MNIYLAGPMTGIKDFNAPAFQDAAFRLRAAGHDVFSPPEEDMGLYGTDVLKSETGDPAEAVAKGFDLRVSMAMDTAFICKCADAIAMLPGWEQSKGALAEHALGVVLGLQFIYL